MASEPATLSDTDKALLRRLQSNCRMTNQQLADSVGMSASACWRRVQALEQDGVISGYGARLDAAKAGLGFSAVAEVSLSRHESAAAEAFVAAVRARPEVLQCFAITGAADYLLRIVTRDIRAYETFLEEFLFPQRASCASTPAWCCER